MKQVSKDEYLTFVNRNRLSRSLGYWSPRRVEWHDKDESDCVMAKECVYGDKREYYIGEQS